MKNIVYLALMLLPASIALAAEKPCAAVKISIFANFASYGCENLANPGKCDELLKCIHHYNVCIVSTSNNKIFHGNSTADISIKTKSIYFGIQQLVDTKNRPICVMAAMVSTPGMDRWWFYRVHRVHGNGIIHEGSFPEYSSTAMQTSTELINKMAEKLKEYNKLYLDEASSVGDQ